MQRMAEFTQLRGRRFHTAIAVTLGSIVLLLIAAAALAIVHPAKQAASFGPLTDEAVAVWQHRDSPTSPTGWDIWYSVIGRPSPGDPTSSMDWHSGGGIAGPIAMLTGDDKNPHIGIHPTPGVTIAVWQHQGDDGDWDVFYSLLTVVGGLPAWSTPTAIADLAGDDYDPAVTVDFDGTAVAVWSHRNPDGSLEILSSVFSSSAWSVPAAVGASGGSASLPEISITSVGSAGGSLAQTVVVAWSDRIATGDHRMFYSTFDGVAWTTPAEIESAATGVGLSIPDVGFSDYSAADPDPYGAFGRLGVTGDGDGNALVVWGGGPILLGNPSPGVVGAIVDVTADTWTPMLTPFGSRFIGVGGCENPDDALTTTLGDFVGVFNFAGFIEHTQKVSGAFTVETFSYDSALDDQRASNGAVSGTEVVSVNWNVPFGSAVSPDTEIIWSVGTVGPTSISWTTAAPLVPGGLAGEDMFPELGSPFAAAIITPELTLSPAVDTNPVGTGHTVTATVKVNGVPVAGVTVDFNVSGANSASGSDVTDANGEAFFSYTGTNEGLDTITAEATVEGQPLTAMAIKEWEGEPAPMVPPRTMGFWKNHPEEIQRILDVAAPIHFATLNGFTPEDIQEVLSQARSRDATLSLFAQGMTTLLNLKPPDISLNSECILPVLLEADAFLHSHQPGTGLTAGRGATAEQLELRAGALALKDQLDAYNNGTGDCFP